MKILIDMNLSPDWCQVFGSNDIESLHWSSVGAVSAPDATIIEWAKSNDYIIFTHDLDFGTILAVLLQLHLALFKSEHKILSPIDYQR